MADIVAIEQIGMVALVRQDLFEGTGDGRLARRAQPGEPDHQGCLSLLLGTHVLIDRVQMPDYVDTHYFILNYCEHSTG